jgi:phospholipid-binding lipoprotein MlaA
VTRRRVASTCLAVGIAALLLAVRAGATESSDSQPNPAALPGKTDAAPTASQTDGQPTPRTDGQADDDLLFEQLDAEEPSSVWDPLERGNRVVFSFNELADKYAIGPISNAYSFVMPDPAERAVRRMFRNLTEPVSFANHLLQFHPHEAGQTFVRFCLNSSVGLAGAFDVANMVGMKPKPTDFGGTLHRYGSPAGPYIVVPLFGPTTARDGLGDLVDSSAMPQNYLLSTTLQIFLQTGNGITQRAEAGQALDALRDGAVDFYAALRSAYYLNRESEFRDSASEPDDLGFLGGGEPGASATLRSSASTSASNPSRSNTEVYSALRKASSETVPLR